MTAAPSGLLRELGVALPVLAAPMAGGPTTPALVLAAANAGSFGFLAGGYRTADDLSAQIDAVAAQTSAYGVNLFAPNRVPVDPAAYARYRELLRSEADRFGVTLPAQPVDDDDSWQDKVEVLLAKPVPLVSFTFGIPDARSLAALRKAGSVLVQSVTSVEEAKQAAAAGADALAVQASAAGGHSATLTPDRPAPARQLPELLAAIRGSVDLPMIAAGGVSTPRDVTEAMTAGVSAVMVGTALLLSPESAASPAHRAALTGPDRGDTVLTRAFTGRPARGLRNSFVDRYDGAAPPGYPALHHLTSPLRKASAAAGDPEWVNLWAGTGYRTATERPAADILRALGAEL